MAIQPRAEATRAATASWATADQLFVTMWHFLLQGMLAESSAEFLTRFLVRFDRRNTSPA